MNQSTTSTKKQRQRHVARMNANFAIEGLTPDDDDKRLQQQYIEGAVTLEDMLAHARDYAAKAQRKST